VRRGFASALRAALAIGATAALVSASFAGRYPRKQLLDRVVARVNGDIITENELLIAAFSDVSKAGTLLPGTAPDVKAKLKEMIDERLLAQAARERIKTLPEEKITNRVEELVKSRRSLFPSKEAFLAALEKRGWDLESYKKYLREQEERRYLIQAALALRVHINDDDIKAYEEQLKRQGKSLVEYRLRQILVALPPDAPAAEVKKAERRVVWLLEQIRGGVPFDRLAREQSDDKVTRLIGGDLGWIGEREMQRRILAAVRSLKKDQVSQPVRTEKGIHIFQLVRKRTPAEMLFRKRMEEERKKWAAELRKTAQIKILVPELAGP